MAGLLQTLDPVKVGLLGVSTAVTAVIAAIGAYNRHVQEQSQAAQAAYSSYEKNAQSISEYKSRIEELQDALREGNLSEQEAYNVREELLGIQDEIKANLGEEAAAFDILTGSIDDANAALDQYSKSEALRQLLENNDAYDRAAKRMTDVITGSTSLFSGDAKAIQDIVDIFKDVFGSDFTYDTFEGTASVTGTAMQIASGIDIVNEKLYTLEKTYNDMLGVELNDLIAGGDWRDWLNNMTAQADAVIEKFGTDYDNSIQLQIVADDDYRRLMDQAAEAKAQVEKALASDKTSDISLALDLAATFGDAVDALDDGGVKNYFQSLYDAMQDEADKMEGKIALRADIELDSDSGQIKTVKDLLAKYFTKDGYIDMTALGTAGQTYQNASTAGTTRRTLNSSEEVGAYRAIAAAAENYGMSVDELIAELGNYDAVQLKTASDTEEVTSGLREMSDEAQEAATKIKQAFADSDLRKNVGKIGSEALDAYDDALDEWINSLSDEDIKIAAEVIPDLDISKLTTGELEKAITNFKISDVLGGFDDFESGINSLSEALENLHNGELELSDVIGLVEQFPALLDYVDPLADGFGDLENGLETLLKQSPDKFVKSLRDFAETAELTDTQREKMLALADAVERMPTSPVDELASKYGDLSDKIRSARDAIDELSSALGEDTNTGYTTRAKAIEEMRKLLESGAVGSESKLWNIAEQYGLADLLPPGWEDDIYAAAEALDALIERRERWTAGATDDAYSSEGIQNWLDDINAVKPALDALGVEFDWANGELSSFNIPTDKWDDFLNVMGMTSDELVDMLIQLGQFAQVDWTAMVPDSKVQGKIDEYVSTMEEIAAIQAKIDSGDTANIDWNAYSALVSKANVLKEALLAIPEEKLIEMGFTVEEGEAGTVLKYLDENGSEVEITLDVNADTSSIPEQVEEAVDQAGDGAEVSVGANVTEATENANALKEAIDAIQGKLVTVRARIVGKQDVISLRREIDGLKDKTVTVRSNTVKTTTNIVRNAGGNTNVPQVNGSAHAGGNWGVPRTEQALVGELGPETVVDPYTGRWYTVGDNGAEFVRLKKGSIIFNHKQTESLLKNGYVAGRGTALASGSAYAFSATANFGKKYSSSSTSSTSSSSSKSSSKSSSSVSAITKAAGSAAKTFEELYRYHQHLVAMEQETQAEYLAWLTTAYQAAYKKGEIELDDFYSYEEEVYNGLKELAQQEFEEIYNYHKHLVAMDQETDEQYLIWLNQAYQDAYKAGKITLEDYYSYQEEVYSGFKKIYEDSFQKEYDFHKHMVAMEQETDANYYKWLMKAYQEAYKAGKIELDEYRKYQEEVFDGLRSLFDDYLGDLEHQVSMHEHYKNDVRQIVGLYRTAIADVEKQIADARKQGLDDNDDYIQKLMDKWWSYTDSLQKVYDTYEKNAKDSTNTLVQFRIKMLRQELSNQKDNLKERLSNLKDFYSKQKELLSDERDEEKYLKEQAEKRKAVTDLELELSRLSYDNSAWAQKRKLQLEQDLVDAREKLAEYEKDHALDVAQNQLDELYEKQEASINAQIDLIDEHLDNAKYLYDIALNDVRNGTVALYNDMIAYNDYYGSAIRTDITEMWEEAYAALDDYYKLNQKVFDSFNLSNATGYSTTGTYKPQTNDRSANTKTVATTPKAKLGSTTTTTQKNTAAETAAVKKIIESTVKQVEKSSTTTKTSTSTSSSKTNTSSTSGKTIKVGGEVNAKGALIYSMAGGTGSKQYFSSDPVYTVLKESGDYIQVRWHGVKSGVSGWFKKSDVTPLASGTMNAKAGLHSVDELGAEYLFTSSDGNRYRVFSGGEKVLNAKATDFLYNFATSGGKILADVIKSSAAMGDLDNISNSRIMGDIHMGDIIINGSADQRTVSQIRREQREGIDYILTRFAQLQ